MFPHPTSRKIARLQAFSRKLLLMRLTPAWELPCTANFPQAIVIKMNIPAKTGPETANSPCFLPVIRENQGESARQAPGSHVSDRVRGRLAGGFPARRLSGNVAPPASGRAGGGQRCACSVP